MKYLNPFEDRVLTVSELSALVKDVLEGTFPRVFVEGEVTGFRVATSGHAYFSLTQRPSEGGTAFTLD